MAKSFMEMAAEVVPEFFENVGAEKAEEVKKKEVIKSENDIFTILEDKGVKMSDRQKEALKNRIGSILNYEPTIGVFGKTGAGKSSLCNALFGKDVFEISDVEACTREPQELLLNVDGENGIRLIDVPGLGESGERDEEYDELYRTILPELDMVIWVLKADDRAYAADEDFYKRLVQPHIGNGAPVFFVLNQCDKVEPFKEWNDDTHSPGATQNENIRKKARIAADFFDIPESRVIPVSARESYNLTALVDEMIYALPDEKKISIFGKINPEHISKKAEKETKKTVKSVFNDVMCGVLDGVENVICGVFDVADGIMDVISALFSWV